MGEIYYFLNNNTELLTVVALLTVTCTILEKTTKIFTPIKETFQYIKYKMGAKKRFYNDVHTLVEDNENFKEKLNTLNERLDSFIERSDKADARLEAKINYVKSELVTLKETVHDNEAERLREVLFNCGGRCRRGIKLSESEYGHVSACYEKYFAVLKENGRGQREFEYITDYYNKQKNID